MDQTVDHNDLSRPAQACAAWAPALVIGMAALGMAAVAEAGPRDAAQAAGVFPPWWSQAGVLAAAGEAGQVTAMGALPFIVVIRSSEGAAGPRLRAAGALLTLKPGLAGSCGS